MCSGVRDSCASEGPIAVMDGQAGHSETEYWQAEYTHSQVVEVRSRFLARWNTGSNPVGAAGF